MWSNESSIKYCCYRSEPNIGLVLRYVDPDTMLLQEDLVDFITYDTGIIRQAEILESINS